MFLHIMDMLQIHMSLGPLRNFMVCHRCFLDLGKTSGFVVTLTDAETQSPTSTSESQRVYM